MMRYNFVLSEFIIKINADSSFEHTPNKRLAALFFNGGFLLFQGGK
jgi:hypothetical protein